MKKPREEGYVLAYVLIVIMILTIVIGNIYAAVTANYTAAIRAARLLEVKATVEGVISNCTTTLKQTEGPQEDFKSQALRAYFDESHLFDTDALIATDPAGNELSLDDFMAAYPPESDVYDSQEVTIPVYMIAVNGEMQAHVALELTLKRSDKDPTVNGAGVVVTPSSYVCEKVEYLNYELKGSLT